jgi:hypothetical protein
MDGRDLLGSFFLSLRSELFLERYGRSLNGGPIIPLWASILEAPWLNPNYQYTEHYKSDDPCYLPGHTCPGGNEHITPGEPDRTDQREYYDLNASTGEVVNRYPDTNPDPTTLHMHIANDLACQGVERKPLPGGCP